MNDKLLPPCPKIKKEFLPEILEDPKYISLTKEGKYLYQNLLTLAYAGWLFDEHKIEIPLDQIQYFVNMNDLGLRIAMLDLATEGLIARVGDMHFLPHYFDHVKEIGNESEAIDG
jgi:hypothetical protein